MEWIDNQINVHSGFNDADYGSNSWQASKLAAFETYLRELPRQTEMLIDIGCFNGSLSERFRRFAAKVIGIDVHE